MDKEWVENRIRERNKKIEKEKQRIKKEICNFGKFTSDREQKLLKSIDAMDCDNKSYESLWKDMMKLELDIEYGFLKIDYSKYDDFKPYEYKDWIDSIRICDLVSSFKDYRLYQDSEPMEFDGDIIITDPCYIIPDGSHEDWRKCNFGYKMELLGINKYMTRDTLYGDWSCTVYNTDAKEEIGEFCADAGLVSVLNLSEVLAYNPDFDYHINKKWTTALIKNFKGTVQFIVKQIKGRYEYDSGWCKKGDEWEEYQVEVVGHGINKVTGEPINFVGKQTWL